jgi:Fic family protein
VREIVGDKSAAELLAAIREAAGPKQEALHEGELTVQQWAESWKLSRASTQKLLQDGVRTGLMESRSVILKTHDGLMRRANVFRQITK